MNLPEIRNIIILDKNGNQVNIENLPAEIIVESKDISLSLIHDVLEAERWNRRQGTRKTKTISEVTGGGRKPYRQKGTGYARQGSIRATQFRGGATVFGPQPVDFHKKVNYKARKIALTYLLNFKASQNILYLIKDLKLDKYSTKTIYNILKKSKLIPENVLSFVYSDNDPYLYKSANNIPFLKMINSLRPTMPELYYNTGIVFTDNSYNEFLQVLKNIK